MNRLKIAEQKAAYMVRNRKKATGAAIAAHVFKGERIAKATRVQYISGWNNGSRMNEATIDRVKRLAEFFGCTVKDLEG